MTPLLKLTALVRSHNQLFSFFFWEKQPKMALNTSFSVAFVISSPSFLSHGLTFLTLVGFIFAFIFLRGFDSETDLWGVM